MYTGPGAGPMLAAATAWEVLAAELYSAARTCESVVSGLVSGAWLGPSAAAMAAAAGPYLAWLTTTAAQAEWTATQGRAAATAYETAFATTVAPPVVAANRAQLAALVATNVFGQNTAAIAATEAQYGEMWAQDAAAMYGYASSAASAVELTPFAQPARTANPASALGQAAGVSSAAAVPAVQPEALLAVIPPTALAVSSTSTALSPSIAGGAWNAATMNNRILISNTQGIIDNGAELRATEAQILEILRSGQPYRAFTPAVPGGLSAGLRAASVSAGMGQAVSAGNLSVPLNWAAAAPGIRTTAYSLPAVSAAAPIGQEAGAGTAFSQMALAGMGGSALAGSIGGGRREHPRMPPVGRNESPPADPSESPSESPESPVAELVVGLRDLGELRDAGLLTSQEFDEQKQRLLAGPLR